MSIYGYNRMETQDNIDKIREELFPTRNFYIPREVSSKEVMGAGLALAFPLHRASPRSVWRGMALGYS